MATRDFAKYVVRPRKDGVFLLLPSRADRARRHRERTHVNQSLKTSDLKEVLDRPEAIHAGSEKLSASSRLVRLG